MCAVLELELCDIDVPALPRATAMVKANLKILRLRVRAMIGCGGSGLSLSSSLPRKVSFVSQLGGEGRKITHRSSTRVYAEYSKPKNPTPNRISSPINRPKFSPADEALASTERMTNAVIRT